MTQEMNQNITLAMNKSCDFTKAFAPECDEESYKEGFSNGIYAFKKIAWHPIDRKPVEDIPIIVLTTDGRLIDNREKVNISILAWFKWIHAKKWAYLKDIIPE